MTGPKFCRLEKQFSHISFNSLQNNKNLNLTKLKAFPDDKLNFTEFMPLMGLKKIVAKGGNAGYQETN